MTAERKVPGTDRGASSAALICNCPRDGDMRRVGVMCDALDPCPIHWTAAIRDDLRGRPAACVAERDLDVELLLREMFAHEPNAVEWETIPFLRVLRRVERRLEMGGHHARIVAEALAAGAITVEVDDAT